MKKKIASFYYDYIYRIIFNVKKVVQRKILKKKLSKKDIRDFKNKHLGERCFIIATGPSLLNQDILKLRDEKTFGMNSICKITKSLEWEPTYFGIQDANVYKKIDKEINELTTTVFYADFLKKFCKVPSKYIEFPLNVLNHAISFKYPYRTKFSDDAYNVVYDGYTITYSIIQIAVYMGFKEIYLLGVDCNYSHDKTKRNFIDIGINDKTYNTAGDRMIEAYKEAKKFADKNDVKIYNATRGGMLEVFERINFDDLIN